MGVTNRQLYTYARNFLLMFREFFIEVKRHHGVTGKALSDRTGISQNHISEYIRGKRKVTDEVLWRMIEAMDELSPGALRDFGRKIVGGSNHQISYEDMGDEDLAQAMIDMGKAWKRRQSRKTPILAS